MLIKFDLAKKRGVLVVKFAFAAAILKIETLRMRKRFARVLRKSTHGFPFVFHIWVTYGVPLGGPSGRWSSAKNTRTPEAVINLQNRSKI